jgi:hypothetical protein
MNYDALSDIKEKCREIVNILIVCLNYHYKSANLSAEILPSVTI